MALCRPWLSNKYCNNFFFLGQSNLRCLQVTAIELHGNTSVYYSCFSTCVSSIQQDLLKDLKYELGGHFEDIVIALMMPAADYDATSLRKAIKVGADNKYYTISTYSRVYLGIRTCEI